MADQRCIMCGEPEPLGMPHVPASCALTLRDALATATKDAAHQTEARHAAERAVQAHAEELAKVTKERDEAIAECRKRKDVEQEADAAKAERDAALSRLERAEAEIARWKKSFSGHVYVENEKYVTVLAERDAALARLAEVIAERDRFAPFDDAPQKGAPE